MLLVCINTLYFDYFLLVTDGRAASAMTTGEVLEWLKKNGFEKYSQSFEKANINGVRLLELVNDMRFPEELGVHSGVDRKSLKNKFQKHIHSLK